MGIISLAFARGRPTRAGLKSLATVLIIGVLIAAYTVIDGLGIRTSTSPWPYIVWLNLLESIPLTIYVTTSQHHAETAFLTAN